MKKLDIHTYINHYRFILFTRIMVKQNTSCLYETIHANNSTIAFIKHC